jgi:hypothetical protein
VAERQLLGDDAPAREAGDVGRANSEDAEDLGRVVRHRLHVDGAIGHCGAARTAIVEGGQTVVVPEPVELELPRLDRVPEAADQEHVRSVADPLGPDVDAARAYVLAHI